MQRQFHLRHRAQCQLSSTLNSLPAAMPEKPSTPPVTVLAWLAAERVVDCSQHQCCSYIHFIGLTLYLECAIVKL